ncbi:MAG TPA: GNAT family N-acetyltransferase [Herpetosiphonaceae bacterium]
MQRNNMHGVIGVAALSADERAAAEHLLAVCRRYDGSDFPLSLEAAEAGPMPGVAPPLDQFLAYEHGTLIGLMRVERSAEPELYGVVHPDYRRRGVGRALLDAARSECRRHGAALLLLVCDEMLESGKAFAAAVGAAFRYAEYRMLLDPAAIDRSQPRHANLRLQPATDADAETLSRIQAAAFGDAEDEVRTQVSHGLTLANRQYYLGLLDGQPIGSLRLGRYCDEADVTAFGVLPQHQGRGYGRHMLLEALDILLAERWPQIAIDVVTENRNALKLYQSCGFREATTYGYYELGA